MAKGTVWSLLLEASRGRCRTTEWTACQPLPSAMWTCTSLRELNLSLNMLSDLPTSSHLCRHESMLSLAGENLVFDTASISSGSDFGKDIDNLSIQSETELESDLEGDAKQP